MQDELNWESVFLANQRALVQDYSSRPLKENNGVTQFNLSLVITTYFKVSYEELEQAYDPTGQNQLSNQIKRSIKNLQPSVMRLYIYNV